MKFNIVQGGQVVTTLSGAFEVVPLTEPAPVPTPPAGVVAVPWVSQIGNLYKLDCGPAGWTMIAQYCGVHTDIDSLIKMMGVENQKTTPDQAIQCWQRLGLKTLKGSQITTWPHMSLVYYTKLPDRYDLSYNGLHFIITLGVDPQGRAVYHDPCWPTVAQGAYKTMSLSAFQGAEVSIDSRVTAVKP